MFGIIISVHPPKKDDDLYILKENLNQNILEKISTIQISMCTSIVYRLKNSKLANDKKFQKIISSIKLHEPVTVAFNSPLGKEITRLYGDYLNKQIFNGRENKYLYRNNMIKKWLNCKDEDEANEILTNLFKSNQVDCGVHTIDFEDNGRMNRPMIVITSSGMCNEGLILSHLEKIIKYEKNTVLLTGFQAQSSNGYLLGHLNEMTEEEKKIKEIRLKTGTYKCSEIKAEIYDMSAYYSSHADQSSLLKYLFINEENRKYTVPNVILNHGNIKGKEVLAQEIINLNKELYKKYPENFPQSINVIVSPKKNAWFDVNSNGWICEKQQLKKKDPLSNELLLNTIKDLTNSIDNLSAKISELNCTLKS